LHRRYNKRWHALACLCLLSVAYCNLCCKFACACPCPLACMSVLTLRARLHLLSVACKGLSCKDCYKERSHNVMFIFICTSIKGLSSIHMHSLCVVTQHKQQVRHDQCWALATAMLGTHFFSDVCRGCSIPIPTRSKLQQTAYCLGPEARTMHTAERILLLQVPSLHGACFMPSTCHLACP